MNDHFPFPFSTPTAAPLVPRFPIRFRNTEIFSVLYESTLEAVAALLPKPLEPLSPQVLLHLYVMHDPDVFGPHREFAVQLDAGLPGGGLRGAYAAMIMLSTDGGLATGREVYGQPKKLGEPTLEARGDLLVAVARRNGIDVLTATMPYKPRPARIEELSERFPFRTNLNYKVIPHIDGSDAIRQITARTLEDVVVHECYAGDATVAIAPNANFPLHRLPMTAGALGFHWRADFTLPFGRVIHDYLAGPHGPSAAEEAP
jgi:acetoacetate decarboxylase